MPRILELKEIDGALWARLDLDLESKDQPVTLWRKSEKDAYRREIIKMCAEAVEELDGDSPVVSAPSR